MIDSTQLNQAQYFGRACLRCATAFTPGQPIIEVGRIGRDLHAVFACADCAPLVRVPRFPEVGSV